MSASQSKKVFISYSTKDGLEWAAKAISLIMTVGLLLTTQFEVYATTSDITRTITFKTGYGISIRQETITIPRQTLTYWQSAQHSPALVQYGSSYSMQYSQYVTAESLGDIPTGIASVAQQGEEDVADTVLSFVQNVGYVLSGYTHYNTLYPVETLATGGVCDDLSVLYATMMVAIGFKVIVVWYPKMIDLGGSKVTHVNVGVHLTIPPEHTTWGNYTYFVLNGVDYYTAETTSDGWRVGDLAYSLRNTNDYLEEAPAPSSPLVILTMTKTEYVTQTSVSLRTLTSTVTQSAVESPVTGTIIGGLIVASVLIAILAYRFGKGKEILTEGLGGGAHQVIVQGAPRSLQWTCNCGRRISATVLPGEVVECRGCGQKHNESKILEIQSSSSVDKSTIFCRECGAKIPRSSKFCNECGVRLT